MPHDKKPAPKRKRKVEVKFDEKARNEYLTGFRKRKHARQLKAQNDIERKLKQKVREERNKKRKAAKEKREEILRGVSTLLDNLDKSVNNDVTNSFTEKVDYGDHEVFVKTDLNFAEAGFLGNSGGDFQDDAENKVVVKQKKDDNNDTRNTKKQKSKNFLLKKKKMKFKRK